MLNFLKILNVLALLNSLQFCLILSFKILSFACVQLHILICCIANVINRFCYNFNKFTCACQYCFHILQSDEETRGLNVCCGGLKETYKGEAQILSIVTAVAHCFVALHI